MVQFGQPPVGVEAIGLDRHTALVSGLQRLRSDTAERLKTDLPSPAIVGILDSVGGVLLRISNLTSDDDIRIFRQSILRSQLSDEVRLCIETACPELGVTPSQVQQIHRSMAHSGIKESSHGMGGEGFLKTLIDNSQLSQLTFNHSNRLIGLDEKLGYLAEVGTVQILYALLDGDLGALSRIVEAQSLAVGATPLVEHLPRLLSVFADVTQFLIDNNRTDAPIRKTAIDFLKTLFSDVCWQLRSTSRALQPFDRMQDVMRQGRTRNPWHYNGVSGTFFDHRKITELVTRDIPRESVAEVLLDVNDYSYRTAVRAARLLVAEYDASPPKSKKKMRTSITKADALLDVISNEGRSHRSGGGTSQGPDQDQSSDEDLHPRLVQKMQILRDRFVTAPEELRQVFEEKAEFISKIEYPGAMDGAASSELQQQLIEKIQRFNLPIDTTTDLVTLIRTLRGAYTSIQDDESPLLLLRVLDPEKIARDPALQVRFAALIHSIKKTRMGDLHMKDTLARSLETALRDQSPYMDCPLVSCSNDSVREMLARLVAVHDLPPSIIPMVDAESLDTTQGPIGKDFNTAGIGRPVGTWLGGGAAYCSTLHPSADFKGVVQFAGSEAAQFFDGVRPGEKPTHGFYPFNTATDAFDDLMRQWGRLKPGENIVMLNVAYGLLRNHWLPRQSKKRVGGEGRTPLDGETDEPPSAAIHTVHLNSSTERRPVTVYELYEQIAGAITSKTRMVLIDSLTRFGDRPCVEGKDRGTRPTSNSGLAELNQRIKRDFPGLPLLVDGAQAFGRTYPPDSVRNLHADIYLMSGGKVPAGVGGGILGLSNELQEEIGYVYHPPSLKLPNIAALGIAMHRLRGKVDFFRPEGNVGQLRNMSLGRKMALRMSVLQQHFNEWIKSSGDHFVRDHLAKISPDFCQQHAADPDRLRTQFGWRVNSPGHDHAADFGGMVTVSNPNVSGAELASTLGSHGYRLLACLSAPNVLSDGTITTTQPAMRAAFHYSHEIEDLDALGDSTLRAHGELARLQFEALQQTGNPDSIRNRVFETWAQP